MKVEVFGATDVGQVRDVNEDEYKIFGFIDNEPKGYVLLADGMGGHKAGEVASGMTVDLISSELNKIIDESVPEKIIYNILSSIDYANTKVFDMANSDLSKSGMGTTCVVAYINDDILYVANIGDSRVYVVNKTNITQITVDHSVVQELVDKGTITPEEAVLHPNNNIITRALGTEKIVDADMFECKLSEGDYVVICSDGLTDMVDYKTFPEIIENADDTQKAVDDMIKTANTNGGRDNITAVIIKCLG